MRSLTCYTVQGGSCVGTGLEAECRAIKLAFRLHLNYGLLLWFELDTYIGLKLDW